MNKFLVKVFQVYVFAFVFLFAARPMSDPDFWFYIKIGQNILNTGIIPRTELFSFTFPGIPYVAHGWLSGVLLYLGYVRLGTAALIILFALIATLAFWITFKRTNSNVFVSGFATLLAVWTVLPNLGVRSRVFSILLASLYLALLARFVKGGRRKSIWLLVPLMTLWANIHGGFFIGLGLIVLTIIGVLLDGWNEGRKLKDLWPEVRLLGLVMLGCILAALVNPYGIQIYTFPLKVLSSPVFQDLIVDWLSPDFHLPTARPLMLLILLTITAIAISPQRVKPSELLLFLATLYATLKTQRNAVVLALVFIPLFSEYFQHWLDTTSFQKSFSRRPSTASNRLSIMLGVLLLLPLIPFAMKLKSTVLSPPKQESLKVPVKAVEFLSQNQITGNTFTAPNVWGGYLIWALPANPVYIDGRDVYPESFVKEFVEIITGRTDWRGPFNNRGVQNVLIEPGTMLSRQLQEAPEWQKVYEDEMSVVFKRR
jgi:hypothetical protein